MMKRCIVSFAAVLFMAGCASNAQQTFADDQTAQHLLHDVPPNGFGRLYLFDGRFVNDTSEGHFAAHFRADELIDDVKVGSLNGGDVLVVDVPAGTHTLVWQERSSKAPMSKPLAVKVRSGERIFVSNDYLMYLHPITVDVAVAGAVGGVIGGAIGGAIVGGAAAAADDNAPDDSSGPFMKVRNNGEEMIQGYDVVLPTSNTLPKLPTSK